MSPVRARPSSRAARACRGLLVAVIAGAVLLPASAARADPGTPTPPSAADVRAARAAVGTARSTLAAADARRAAAEQRLAVLEARVEAATERWNAARADADAARAQQGAAAAEAGLARAASDGAQRDVDRLAVASYQVGADLSGGLGEWAAIVDSAFGPGGIQGLADRTTAVGLVTADRRRDLDRARELALVAAQKEADAARAAEAVAAREQDADAAAQAVTAEQASRRGEVARLVAARDAASATLARATGTAATLERQRREALARAAAARARAAAEAARRAREAAAGRPTRLPDEGSGTPRSWPQGESTTTVAQRLGALAFARAQFGDPYVAGEAGPDAYDCSGLTAAAYRSVGKPMIQYSQAQFAAGQKIPVSALQPGDLVYFATDPSDWTTIHHVGMYEAGGVMVEAPHTGDVVKRMTIWQDELVPYGTRP